MSLRSVDGPAARCYKLKQVFVWITEVDTLSTAFPSHLAFNQHLASLQPAFPGFEFLRRDGKREVRLSAAVVRRNGSTLNHYWSRRSALLEKQQDLVAARL